MGGNAPPRTNAQRILEAAGVACRNLSYDLAGEEFSAEAVADRLGLPRRQVFKTLLTVGPARGPAFALIPAGTVLSLKNLSRLLGERRMAMAPLTEVPRLTGYRRGAVTVPGAKRPFPAAVDETAFGWEEMAVSGGAPGTQLLVETASFLEFIAARTAPLARAGAPSGPEREGGASRTPIG